MSITADNSWDTRDGFSMPRDTRPICVENECQASILGAEQHGPGLPKGSGSSSGENASVGGLGSVNRNDGGVANDTASWNRVIEMWLQWSSAYEQLSGKLFEDGENAQNLEALLDEVDQLRLEAVELSEGLLKN